MRAVLTYSSEGWGYRVVWSGEWTGFFDTRSDAIRDAIRKDLSI